MELILATDRDWFASALEGVLQAEDYRVRRVEGVEELLDAAPMARPSAVIVDTHFGGGDTARAITGFRDAWLSADVPLLVYSAGSLADDEYAELISAGAWEVIEGPIRAGRFLPVLERFLEISARGDRSLNGDGPKEARLPDAERLTDRIPVVAALAQREETNIAVIAIGPTGSIRGEIDSPPWKKVEDLRFMGLRKSDLCGWFANGDEFVVVAYSASREGARVLANRILEMAADRLGVADSQGALSVGIVEICPDDLPDEIRAEDSGDTEAKVLTRARAALEEARRAGGGVWFAS